MYALCCLNLQKYNGDRRDRRCGRSETNKRKSRNMFASRHSSLLIHLISPHSPTPQCPSTFPTPTSQPHVHPSPTPRTPPPGSSCSTRAPLPPHNSRNSSCSTPAPSRSCQHGNTISRLHTKVSCSAMLRLRRRVWSLCISRRM